MSRTFTEEIKYQWNNGGMHIKLIGINLVVFILINSLLAIGSLYATGYLNPLENIVDYIFTLKGDFTGFLTRPWGLITSIFAHYSFMHLAFNMLFFYYMSVFFLQYFSNQRMLYTYILGGIAGGILQIIAYATFPALQGTTVYVVGASGAVNAIFMATAFYRPMATVHLFGIIKVRMIVLALIFFFMDIFQMGDQDNVAHFAHLGGAIFGFWSIYKVDSKRNIITLAQNFVGNLVDRFKGRSKPKMKHYKGGASHTSSKGKTDEDYLAEKKKRQAEIDVILEKISKSGYESLTAREKALLFDQSRNG